jgi:uncharacterized protein (DUF427 family)
MEKDSSSPKESVWDYPRPPRVENTNRKVRVIFREETIAESQRAKRVLETSHPPVYYFPPEDVRREFLHPFPRRSWCEFKGSAHYWTVRVGDQEAPNSAWSYPEPRRGYDTIQDHVAFYPGPMDACYVDGERVQSKTGRLLWGLDYFRHRRAFQGRAGDNRVAKRTPVPLPSDAWNILKIQF